MTKKKKKKINLRKERERDTGISTFDARAQAIRLNNSRNF